MRTGRLLLAAAALAAVAPAASAQAVVKGRVVADSTRRPLALTDVILEELKQLVTTGDSGGFRFENIPEGVYTLRVRRIGFRTAFATLRIEAPDSVYVVLPLTAWIPQLEPILVQSRMGTSRDLQIAERHREGFGTLIPHERLREQEYLRLEDLLRKYGVRIAYPPGSPRPIPVSPRARRLRPGGSTLCPMTTLLDGVEIYDDLRFVTIQGLGAIEIFKSAASAPVQYSGLNRDCGVILLWTRDH